MHFDVTLPRQVALAAIMLPILRRELAHISSDAAFRKRNLDAREICGEFTVAASESTLQLFP